MDKLNCLLERHGLESYSVQFLSLGLKHERDFINNVTDEDLTNLGLTQVEKKRFKDLQLFIRRLRAPVAQNPVQEVMESFTLKYTYPKCPKPKFITDMDPAQNSVEDLMVRICFEEIITSSRGVCLFTEEGLPLTDDPFFNTWSLQDRHIKDGDLVYAIFTPKENLLTPQIRAMNPAPVFGTDTVRCHVMLKGDFEVKVDLDSTTVADLKNRLSAISGIPVNVLHYRCDTGSGNSLKDLGITEETTLNFSLSSFTDNFVNSMAPFWDDISTSVQQTKKGISVFLSSLYVTKYEYKHVDDYKDGADDKNDAKEEHRDVDDDEDDDDRDDDEDEEVDSEDNDDTEDGDKHGNSNKKDKRCDGEDKSKRGDLVGYIWEVTDCRPLAQSLHQIIEQDQMISRSQKIAIFEGLYTLFREILPKYGSVDTDRVIEDEDVFEHSLFCWSYIMNEAKRVKNRLEKCKPLSLVTDKLKRFCEPVTVPGVEGHLERADVLQTIKDGGTVPHCTEVLWPTSLKRCTNIEKILLSVHPRLTMYYSWIPGSRGIGQSFKLEIKKSLDVMKKEMKAFPFLNITPPLVLKKLGYSTTSLVYLSEDNLGVYLHKTKAECNFVVVHDFLSGKGKHIDVDVLAAQTGDFRNSNSLSTTRTPKEAILMLIDTSSSMTENCYGSVDIQKIHAVKELFRNFANRSMAYNFHHIVGLVKFDSTVKTLQTFTETLETFKDSMESLEASGATALYDALHRGRIELEKVKATFPDCLLRILCLTDGDDLCSTQKVSDVTKSLIRADVIVDSVLLGEVENHVLHGISIASGGCCFKPNTSTDGLKLFETETVLSVRIRKPRKKADPAVITETFLKELFAVHGYDDVPEAQLPTEISNKVTLTENALKKKIHESKDRRFMEKDRRILEELKNLHCHPHPFFQIFPSETDFTFWKLLMEGPPDTPYESGVFELFCQFGTNYPVKPPTVRFITPIYHCNINNVGRICHNIFDRGYNAHVTMRAILDAVYGLLIAPEPQDPLDSILAEEYLTSRKKYEEQAKKLTEQKAGQSLEAMEKELVATAKHLPKKLICPLTKKIYVDPVITKYQGVYERKAIEKHLKKSRYEPFTKPRKPLRRTDWKTCIHMKAMVDDYRSGQISENNL